MKRFFQVIVLMVFAIAGASAAAATNTYARAMAIKKQGLPNLHRISDRLYRSAQPTANGFEELKRMGVKTVVNLRAFHSDRKPLAEAGLKQEHIYFNTWHPEDEDIVRFLKFVNDTNNAPVLVHCQHGADRTGTMVAIYRIAVEGWSKQEAIKEMVGEQFGFHKVWGNLTRYINGLDIEALRNKAGIKPAVLEMPNR
jgi:protein tyrosine/serine phosphatase